MFKDNQHTTEYYSIIESAKERGGKYKTRYMARKHLGYVESHHIVPESMGGNDTLDNRVWLTAHEHLRCHLLLTEMCENNGHRHKMLLAATRMMNRQDSRRDREKLLPLQITQEEIDWLSKIRIDSAKAHSEYMSEKFKGEGNPFYGKTHTAESNESRSKKLKGIPITDEHKKATSKGRLKNSAHISAIVTGTKNPRYNPTVYNWENINTAEKKSATRLEMITADPKLKSGISGVITGKAEQYKGWRIVK
jgi:hypothetical protein